MMQATSCGGWIVVVDASFQEDIMVRLVTRRRRVLVETQHDFVLLTVTEDEEATPHNDLTSHISVRIRLYKTIEENGKRRYIVRSRQNTRYLGNR